MPTSALTGEQLRRYFSLRREGVAATHAYRSATTARAALPYRPGPGASIQFALADRPELAGYVITAVAEPDPDPDVSWLGTFTDTACPEAIELPRHDPRCCRYFIPTHTVAQRRAEFSARGCARGVAQLLAEQAARADARLAGELDCRLVTVSVHKADVLLGTAVLGTDFASNGHPDDELAAVVADYGLIDEAVDQARAALPQLIAALAA